MWPHLPYSSVVANISGVHKGVLSPRDNRILSTVFSSIRVGQRGETSNSDTQDQRKVSWLLVYFHLHLVPVFLQGHFGGGKQMFNLFIDVFCECSRACAVQRHLPLPWYTLDLKQVWQEDKRKAKLISQIWKKKITLRNMLKCCNVFCKKKKRETLLTSSSRSGNTERLQHIPKTAIQSFVISERQRPRYRMERNSRKWGFQDILNTSPPDLQLSFSPQIEDIKQYFTWVARITA